MTRVSSEGERKDSFQPSLVQALHSGTMGYVITLLYLFRALHQSGGLGEYAQNKSHWQQGKTEKAAV